MHGNRNTDASRLEPAEAVRQWIQDFRECKDGWGDLFKVVFSTAEP
ncbi:MAG: hypothetical protein O7D94_03045 [Planctomycetota bacterium]|nr:hypothetical protein [Planctomycetota bacterium]